MTTTPTVRLGLRENAAQFWLLVGINAFVGAMAGMERSILPALAEQEFHLVARTAILSFILVFGISKAIANYAAGRLADGQHRKRTLIAGWLIAVPVPLLLMAATTWRTVPIANVLLGASQGLTWSMTVIMKTDLVGRARRGLAMGLNEFAGYLALAASAWATGWIAASYGLRPAPFYLGIGIALIGLSLSVAFVRETTAHVRLESADSPEASAPGTSVFWRTTLGDRNLSSLTQVGLVNNLNDAMVWGLFPLVFAAVGLDLAQVGWLAALYPATWSVAQLGTGALSDRIGRKPLIVGGMIVQSVGIVVVWLSNDVVGFASGVILLGLGTAAVYPTLLAAIGDVAAPAWRGSAIGAYRFWRDSGYAVGALVAGVAADMLGLGGALSIVAALTLASGLLAWWRLDETRTSSLVVPAPAGAHLRS